MFLFALNTMWLRCFTRGLIRAVFCQMLRCFQCLAQIQPLLRLVWWLLGGKPQPIAAW